MARLGSKKVRGVMSGQKKIIFDGPRRSKEPLTQASDAPEEGGIGETSTTALSDGAANLPTLPAEGRVSEGAEPSAEDTLGTSPNALLAPLLPSNLPGSGAVNFVKDREVLPSPTRASTLRHNFTWEKIDARDVAERTLIASDEPVEVLELDSEGIFCDSEVLDELYEAAGGPTEWRVRTGWGRPLEPESDELQLTGVHGVSVRTAVGLSYVDGSTGSGVGRVMAVSLRANLLHGKLIPALGRLVWLVRLEIINHPHLRGGIPPELGNCAQLELLYLFANRLSGGIPDELGKCRRLKELKIQLNRLTGSLPPSVCSLPRLTHLHAQSNQLTGEVPEVR